MAIEADWRQDGDVPDSSGLAAAEGRRIKGFDRTGKNLFLRLDSGVLWTHMGMTGRLCVMQPTEESLRFTRATVYLDDERRIELDDARRWAGMRYGSSKDEFLSGLGPDALDAGLTTSVFIERVGQRRSPVKAVLMDQTVVAGVGNIYADEALHMAGISPARRADRISSIRLDSLLRALRTCLLRALRFIVEHTDTDGRPYVVGAYDDRMRIAREKAAACPDCLTPLKNRKIGGRTTYYCALCQT